MTPETEAVLAELCRRELRRRTLKRILTHWRTIGAVTWQEPITLAMRAFLAGRENALYASYAHTKRTEALCESWAADLAKRRQPKYVYLQAADYRGHKNQPAWAVIERLSRRKGRVAWSNALPVGAEVRVPVSSWDLAAIRPSPRSSATKIGPLALKLVTLNIAPKYAPLTTATAVTHAATRAA